jgi:hypothetical protein
MISFIVKVENIKIYQKAQILSFLFYVFVHSHSPNIG